MPNPTFQYSLKTGETIPAGKQMILPVSRALQIHVPGLKGGLIWNRPVGVWVQSADGSEHYIPIRDLTRRVQLTILGAGLLGSLLVMLLLRRRTPSRQPSGRHL